MSAVVASIGTTHPWNVAGLGLDIKVARAFGVTALSVVAAVSAQDEKGMRALEAVSARLLDAQLETLPMDEVGALRVGALPGVETVTHVAAFLQRHPAVPAVVDPVIGPSSGGTFLDEPSFAAFRDRIAVLPSVILTPNIDEAARLLGVANVRRETLADAAAQLRKRGARAVLLKGGHLDGDPADALAAEDGTNVLEEERLPASMRGTGCVLAMAIACELARGLALLDAVQSGRAYVRSRIVGAHPFHGINAAF